MVTNGATREWISRLGLAEDWEGRAEWIEMWRSVETNAAPFFSNALGVNVTARDEHKEFLVFGERGGYGHNDFMNASTLATIAEGTRRKFGGNLFDETSLFDSAPNLKTTTRRALQEELGIMGHRTSPIFLSLGRVISVHQIVLLAFWPLRLTPEEIKAQALVAPDGLEVARLHFVPFSRRHVLDFIAKQESKAPVNTWSIVSILYALAHNHL